MLPPVVGEKRGRGGAVRAVLAREGLLAGVDPRVLRQRRLPLEHLGAHRAREVPALLVDEVVPLQRVGAGELHLADGAALRGGVGVLHVVLLPGPRGEHHGALLARQRTLVVFLAGGFWFGLVAAVRVGEWVDVLFLMKVQPNTG